MVPEVSFDRTRIRSTEINVKDGSPAGWGTLRCRALAGAWYCGRGGFEGLHPMAAEGRGVFRGVCADGVSRLIVADSGCGRFWRAAR